MGKNVGVPKSHEEAAARILAKFGEHVAGVLDMRRQTWPFTDEWTVEAGGAECRWWYAVTVSGEQGSEIGGYLAAAAAAGSERIKNAGDADFDQIGKVLMGGLEAWIAEADRRANIENKEQET